MDAIIGDMRPVAKKEAGKGFIDTADNLWRYFLQRSRANLHIVLCMSPVGVLLPSRCRKFPGLINCTTVDWFLPWPESGLKNVACHDGVQLLRGTVPPPSAAACTAAGGGQAEGGSGDGQLGPDEGGDSGPEDFHCQGECPARDEASG